MNVPGQHIQNAEFK